MTREEARQERRLRPSRAGGGIDEEGVPPRTHGWHRGFSLTLFYTMYSCIHTRATGTTCMTPRPSCGAYHVLSLFTLITYVTRTAVIRRSTPVSASMKETESTLIFVSSRGDEDGLSVLSTPKILKKVWLWRCLFCIFYFIQFYTHLSFVNKINSLLLVGDDNHTSWAAFGLYNYWILFSVKYNLLRNTHVLDFSIYKNFILWIRWVWRTVYITW